MLECLEEALTQRGLCHSLQTGEKLCFLVKGSVWVLGADEKPWLPLPVRGQMLSLGSYSGRHKHLNSTKTGTSPTETQHSKMSMLIPCGGVPAGPFGKSSQSIVSGPLRIATPFMSTLSIRTSVTWRKHLCTNTFVTVLIIMGKKIRHNMYLQ